MKTLLPSLPFKDPKTMYQEVLGFKLVILNQSAPDRDWNISTSFPRKAVMFEGMILRESRWTSGVKSTTAGKEQISLYLQEADGWTPEKPLAFIADGNPYLYYNPEGNGTLLRPDAYNTTILQPHMGTAPVVTPATPEPVQPPAPVPTPVTPQ